MLTIVGAGPGHPKYLTQDAIDALRQADLVLAFERIADTAAAIAPQVIRLASVSAALAYVPSERHVALLASGDPGFYGILEYLKQRAVVIDRVVPGLSSFQYLLAALGKSWHAAHFLSLHGRAGGLEQVAAHPLTIILTDRRHTPRLISRELGRMGISGRLYIGYNLSYDNERIVEARIGDAVAANADIAVVVVERDAVGTNDDVDS